MAEFRPGDRRGGHDRSGSSCRWSPRAGRPSATAAAALASCGPASSVCWPACRDSSFVADLLSRPILDRLHGRPSRFSRSDSQIRPCVRAGAFTSTPTPFSQHVWHPRSPPAPMARPQVVSYRTYCRRFDRSWFGIIAGPATRRSVPDGAATRRRRRPLCIRAIDHYAIPPAREIFGRPAVPGDPG